MSMDENGASKIPKTDESAQENEIVGFCNESYFIDFKKLLAI